MAENGRSRETATITFLGVTWAAFLTLGFVSVFFFFWHWQEQEPSLCHFSTTHIHLFKEGSCFKEGSWDPAAIGNEQFILSLSKAPCWVPSIQDYLDNSRDSVETADPTSCSPPQYLVFVPLNRGGDKGRGLKS